MSRISREARQFRRLFIRVPTLRWNSWYRRVQPNYTTVKIHRERRKRYKRNTDTRRGVGAT